MMGVIPQFDGAASVCWGGCWGGWIGVDRSEVPQLGMVVRWGCSLRGFAGALSCSLWVCGCYVAHLACGTGLSELQSPARAVGQQSWHGVSRLLCTLGVVACLAGYSLCVLKEL